MARKDRENHTDHSHNINQETAWGSPCADGAHLLASLDIVEAQGGQPVQQGAPLGLRDAIPEAPTIEQVISDSSDCGVASVLGSQQNWLVTLKHLNAEK